MRWFLKHATTLVSLVVLAFAGAVMAIAASYLYLKPQLPQVETLNDIELQTPLRIYSEDGVLIGEFGEKRRKPVHIQTVPETFLQAFLAAEDDRFYSHPGVDITGLLRAAGQLVASGQIKTGGSTITMQVAKNYFLSKERTFARKINEILLALNIENELSKDEILELYVNKIFLGHQAYGIEAAAQVYYGRNVRELSLAQMAMIAGLPKAPSAYNPLINPSRAKVRRDWILGRMHQLKYINDEQYQTALAEPLSAEYHGTKRMPEAAYVAEMVRLHMVKKYGTAAYTEGFHVYTTVNSQLQKVAHNAVVEGISRYDERHGYRGPEAQLDLAKLLSENPPTEDSASTEDQEQQEADLEEAPADGNASSDTGNDALIALLKPYRQVAHWRVALVLSISDTEATVLTRQGETLSLPWEQLKSLKRYVDVNTTVVAENIDELLQAGDVIRLKPGKTPNSWQLSQLPAAQAALVSLDAFDGSIQALVGGYDYGHSRFNRITQASRQPGSNFKPFIYAAALENGFTAASVINDAPIVFDDKALESTWRPTNDSGKFYGPTRLRKALYNSRNLVSIRLLRELGFNKAIRYAGQFGFNTRVLPRDLSLALGSHSMTPLDIVTAYGAFANGGFKVKPHVIDRIEDRDRQTIYQANHPVVCADCTDAHLEVEEPQIDVEDHVTIEDILSQTQAETPKLAERIIDERVAYLMDNILKDVIRKGTGRKARVLKRDDIAGKTGTTNGPTDAWFSGYGGGIVTTAWAGFDQNDVLGKREYGGSVALPIWIDYMAERLKDRPALEFAQPEGIVSVRIDPETGELAKPNQSNAIFELFRSEYAPKASGSSSGSADNSGSPEPSYPEDSGSDEGADELDIF